MALPRKYLQDVHLIMHLMYPIGTATTGIT